MSSAGSEAPSSSNTARRLDPPARQDNGRLAGPAPERTDVPSGEELFAEWQAGQAEDPVLTYEDLAKKYNCSASLVHKRIQKSNTKSGRESETKVDKITVEMRCMRNILEGFFQVQENCGMDAVERVLTYVRMHMEARNEQK